jgi:hypothetical protein
VRRDRTDRHGAKPNKSLSLARPHKKQQKQKKAFFRFDFLSLAETRRSATAAAFLCSLNVTMGTGESKHHGRGGASGGGAGATKKRSTPRSVFQPEQLLYIDSAWKHMHPDANNTIAPDALQVRIFFLWFFICVKRQKQLPLLFSSLFPSSLFVP